MCPAAGCKAHSDLRRAENETRTRDPDLGKVVLYQLSYFRKYVKDVLVERDCKDTAKIRISKKN